MVNDVAERTTPNVYHDDVQNEHLDKEYEDNAPDQSDSSNSNQRTEWSPQNHI